MTRRPLPASTMRLRDAEDRLEKVVERLADERVDHQAVVLVDDDLRPLAVLIDHEVYSAFADLLDRVGVWPIRLTDH